MRWYNTVFVALATVALFGTAEAQSVRRVTTIDPVTGVETTEIIQNRGGHHGWRHRGYPTVLGAPVYARRGFPAAPFNGQTVWRAGRNWEFDAALGRWIIIR